MAIFDNMSRSNDQSFEAHENINLSVQGSAQSAYTQEGQGSWNAMQNRGGGGYELPPMSFNFGNEEQQPMQYQPQQCEAPASSGGGAGGMFGGLPNPESMLGGLMGGNGGDSQSGGGSPLSMLGGLMGGLGGGGGSSDSSSSSSDSSDSTMKTVGEVAEVAALFA